MNPNTNVHLYMVDFTTVKFVQILIKCYSDCLNPNHLGFLARNLPQSAKVQHCALSLWHIPWTQAKLGQQAPYKVAVTDGPYRHISLKSNNTMRWILAGLRWLGLRAEITASTRHQTQRLISCNLKISFGVDTSSNLMTDTKYAGLISQPDNCPSEHRIGCPSQKYTGQKNVSHFQVGIE